MYDASSQILIHQSRLMVQYNKRYTYNLSADRVFRQTKEHIRPTIHMLRQTNPYTFLYPSIS
jgi:hypothetical protein